MPRNAAVGGVVLVSSTNNSTTIGSIAVDGRNPAPPGMYKNL